MNRDKDPSGFEPQSGDMMGEDVFSTPPTGEPPVLEEPAREEESHFASPEGEDGLQVPPPEEEAGDAFGEEVPVAQGRRMLPILVGAGFLVFAGVMAYIQFRPKAPVEPAFSPMEMPAPASFAAPAPEDSVSLDNAAVPVAVDQAAFPRPYDVSREDGSQDVLPEILSRPEQDGEPSVPFAAAMPEAAGSMAVSRVPDPETADKLAALEVRVQQLTAQLDDVAALKARIGELEKKLADVSKAKPVAAKVETKPAVVRKAEPAKAAPATKVQPAVAKKAVKAPKWELRSIAGDAAWVGEVGKVDVKRVLVGDTLEGIGKITAIHKVDGAWVVEGSKGILKP